MPFNKNNYNQPEKNLNNELNDRQKEAVSWLEGPVLIAAGAGSGKTRTLTSRLIKLIESGVEPAKIVAVTFTNKAAKEMRERIFKCDMQNTTNKMPFVGTLHSFGVQILKNEFRAFGRQSNFSIFDSDDSLRLIKNILKKSGLDSEKFSAPGIQNKISWAKSELIGPKKFSEQAENVFEKTGAEVYKKYEQALKTNNGFDFDDLIEKPVRLFKGRPAILELYQNRWTHFLVDEYQDINTAQYWLLKLLAKKHRNFCAVGDDQQAIYAFRGADFRNFLNFERDWPKSKIILLEENYRSCANIIRAASAVISQNQFQKPKTLWTKNEEGELVDIVKTANEEEEAALIANAINEIPNSKSCSYGTSPKGRQIPITTAILYRTNAQSRAIEQALIERDIPYEIFGGVKFYERKEIKDLLAGLRYGFNPRDEISAERIAKNFNKKVAAALVQGLPELARTANISDLIGFFIETSNYFQYLESNFRNYEERIENVKEFIGFAAGFENFSAPLGLQLFLEQATLAQGGDAPTNNLRLMTNDSRQATRDKRQAAVKLMTIHLAKGLEFDNVFIAGCEEGLLPHHRSYGRQEDLEEERRLFYVAMTRAKKKLRLVFSKTPSRFLSEIPPELVKFENLVDESETFDDEESYIEYS